MAGIWIKMVDKVYQVVADQASGKVGAMILKNTWAKRGIYVN